jgi:ribosomal subunit interface protein
MPVPVQITFRNMESSEAVERSIRERAEKLEHFHDRIVACHVAVEERHRHQRQGRIFHVRVTITVPGRMIVVDRDPGEHHAHEDVYVAIRDAFDAARRQLEDHARTSRDEIKTHAVPDHGRVESLIADEGYGFIAAVDGSTLYFHRNSVTNGEFDHLTVGDEVRFVVEEGEGEHGPQASTVVRLKKHHLPPTEVI